MAVTNGPVSMTGTSEERTYNLAISTPDDADPQNYIITAQRGIVVRDANGKIVQRTMDESVAVSLGGRKYKTHRQFAASAALAKDPTILTKIAAIVDAIITDQKAEEP
jgi:hypothetical protein